MLIREAILTNTNRLLNMFFFLNDCAISWCSEKQFFIVLSTMEAEYVACSSTIKEAVLLRRFFPHFEIVKTTSEPMKIYYDNMAALAYAKDPKYHGNAKHIQIRYNFVRDMIMQNEVVMRHILMSKMTVDPFTKPIMRNAFARHAKSLSLCRI